MLSFTAIQRDCVFAAIAAISAIVSGSAAVAEDFFTGKQISLIISTGVGGSFDANARILARYLGGHLPGKPTVVPKNMPGAGHVRAANYLYNQAPSDGTTIGALVPAFILGQVFDGRGVQFNAAKFKWIGATSTGNSTVYAWHSAGISSIEDAMKGQVLMGATGVGSYTTLYPTVLNNVVGTKFKIIAGYDSAAQINLAMERGEVQGRAGNNLSSLKQENPEWLIDKKVVLLVQVGLERDAEFPAVPLITELGQTDEQRRILHVFSVDVILGRPLLAPPGLSAERLAILRKGYDDAVNDPAFMKESGNLALGDKPLSGAFIEREVTDLVATPRDIIEKAMAAMNDKGFLESGKGEHKEAK